VVVVVVVVVEGGRNGKERERKRKRFSLLMSCSMRTREIGGGMQIVTRESEASEASEGEFSASPSARVSFFPGNATADAH